MTFLPSEISFLKKGPKFVIDERSYEGDTKISILNLIRNIKLNEFFDDSDLNTTVKPIFKLPNSSFNPKEEEIIHSKLLTDQLLNININSKYNANKHTKVLTSLKTKFLKNNLMITKADKGNALIILNRTDYSELVLNHLKDTNHYEKVIKCKEKDIIDKIKSNFCGFENVFTENEIKFLTKPECPPSSMYILPKIHKCKEIINNILNAQSEYIHIEFNKLNLESRPIISSKKSVTSNLSFFLHTILQQFLPFVKTYIKDSFELKSFINQKLASSVTFFVSIDIKSLYTNINNESGLEAINYFLTKYYSQVSLNKYPKVIILNLLKLLLYNNYFYYQKKCYRQINGCAMGSICSPVYAILVLGFFEINLFNMCSNKFGILKTNKIFNHFRRYIDDLVLLWPLNKEEFVIFIELLKSAYTNLQIVVNVNNDYINFLDLNIYKKDNHLETDIYRKPTDNLTFVPFDSNHPSHVKRNIPYNIFRRIILLVSEPSNQLKRINEVKNQLINLNYPNRLLNDAIKKSNSINSTNNENSNVSNIYCVIKHCNANNDIVRTINHYFSLLHNNDNSSNTFFNNKKIVFSRTNCSNIVKSLNHSDPKVVKCNVSRCGTCSVIITGFNYCLPNNITIFPNVVISCRSKNLIYILKCSFCSSFYIGETECELRFRVTLHRQHCTTDYGTSYLNNHIKQCSKSFNGQPSFKIFPFYQNNKMSKIIRQQLEQYFIKKYNPSLNSK